jgi:hypothetical protein
MKDKLSTLAGMVILVALFLWFGPGCTYYGVHKLVAGPDKEVTCGSAVMHEGDVCRETRNGSPAGATSYSEQQKEQTSFWNRIMMPVLSTVIGGAITLVGLFVVWTILSSRRRRPQAPAGP